MRMPRLRAPIVLIHGLFGFDRMRMGPWVLTHYFHGVPEAMREAGNRVLVARLSPTGGIATRAEQLEQFLEREAPAEAVHLFGHSMGGLDARYLISRRGWADRVLSLTTLGTPHRGSPFADWALARLGRLVRPLFDFLALPRAAFDDLTVAACRRFNEETPDAPGVRYFSVAGRHESHWLNRTWEFTARVVRRAEGPNDGVVSLASARWGESCEVWEGDHMNLINWPQPWVPAPRRNRIPSYAALLGRLADEGF
jgi:triacylglycerol lipase